MNRNDNEQIKFGMAMLEHLPMVEAPDEIWESIEASFETARLAGRSPRSAFFGRDSFGRNSWRWVSAVAAIVLIGVSLWLLRRGTTGEGHWIETTASSRTEIKIGDIGTVEVEPNTKVRVVTEKPSEHRLSLAHGEIRAKISAPPRLFFVDTASGTAVDLGCEYALNIDKDGLGLLRVTKGWVSFQWNGLESLVPAGASCRMRPQMGPSTPYFDDAPEALKQAIDDFGFEKTRGSTLNIILAESRVRDTLSLWHLLSRVDREDRALVYDRIAALTPIPAGVSREKALNLDPETLRKWKEELAWTW